MNEQINTGWYIYSMDYYLAIKRNEVLTCATTWMNLRNTMLGERSQTQKLTYCLILHLYELSRTRKSTETDVDEWFPGTRRGRTGSDCLRGMGIPFGVMKMF